MKEISEKEFGNMFYLNIIPIAKQYESKRKKLNFIRNILSTLPVIAFLCPFIGIFSFIIFNVIILDFIFHIEINKIVSDCWVFGGFVFSFILFAIWILTIIIFGKNQENIKKLQTTIKESVLLRLFECIEVEYITDNSTKKLSKSVLAQLGVQDAKIDDIIKGEYKNLPFTLIDYDYAYERGKKGRSCGLLIATKINKTFTGDTFICDSYHLSSFWSCKQTFLEDVEFNNLFNVFTNNEIDTRYLLTPTFVERLKIFKRDREYNFNIHFTKKTYSESNIFIQIKCYKDFFDIDIGKSLLDKENYYNIYRDITDIMDIVDALKLDQNIGM